jgi:hypothetical protein
MNTPRRSLTDRRTRWVQVAGRGWRPASLSTPDRPVSVAKANRLPGMNRLHLNGYGPVGRRGRHEGEERGNGPGCQRRVETLPVPSHRGLRPRTSATRAWGAVSAQRALSGQESARNRACSLASTRMGSGKSWLGTTLRTDSPRSMTRWVTPGPATSAGRCTRPGVSTIVFVVPSAGTRGTASERVTRRAGQARCCGPSPR